MGILSNLFGVDDKANKIKPNSNSIKLADIVLPMLELSRMGISHLIDPVLQTPSKKQFIWAYVYGFVGGLGAGYGMSVREIEDGAFLVFQKFFEMTKSDAFSSVGLVQSMSETENGLKWMMAGKDSIERYMTKQLNVPVDSHSLAFLIADLNDADY